MNRMIFLLIWATVGLLPAFDQSTVHQMRESLRLLDDIKNLKESGQTVKSKKVQQKLSKLLSGFKGRKMRISEHCPLFKTAPTAMHPLHLSCIYRSTVNESWEPFAFPIHFELDRKTSDYVREQVEGWPPCEMAVADLTIIQVSTSHIGDSEIRLRVLIHSLRKPKNVGAEAPTLSLRVEGEYQQTCIIANVNESSNKEEKPNH